MDPAALRAEFPVLERVAYMNAGTDGPVPRAGADAARREIVSELDEGRATMDHFERVFALASGVRERLAALFGCSDAEVALTGSTTDGVNTVLSALDLGRGDEVVTSDEEHPGLLAPLAALGRRRGVEIRVVPFGELPSELGPRTKLVACSHVSWVSGRIVDAEALARSDALVLLDGAQGLGAVPVDVGRLGCDFYAASGQKWLCGPEGTGSLYVRRDLAEELLPPWPGFLSLADPGNPAELTLREGAQRFDHGILARFKSAWSLAALELLERAGWERVLERGPALAARLAEALASGGADVVPRAASTLVAWRSPVAEADARRLAGEGIVVRHLPGRGLVRASVGAWSTKAEVDRVAAVATGG